MLPKICLAQLSTHTGIPWLKDPNKQDWLIKEAGFWAYMQSSKTSHKPFSAKASLTLPFAVWQFILKCLGQYWKQSVEWNRSQSRDLVL